MELSEELPLEFTRRLTTSRCLAIEIQSKFCALLVKHLNKTQPPSSDVGHLKRVCKGRLEDFVAGCRSKSAGSQNEQRPRPCQDEPATVSIWRVSSLGNPIRAEIVAGSEDDSLSAGGTAACASDSGAPSHLSPSSSSSPVVVVLAGRPSSASVSRSAAEDEDELLTLCDSLLKHVVPSLPAHSADQDIRLAYVSVPAHPPATKEQFDVWNLVWPLNFRRLAWQPLAIDEEKRNEILCWTEAIIRELPNSSAGDNTRETVGLVSCAAQCIIVDANGKRLDGSPSDDQSFSDDVRRIGNQGNDSLSCRKRKSRRPVNLQHATLLTLDAVLEIKANGGTSSSTSSPQFVQNGRGRRRSRPDGDDNNRPASKFAPHTEEGDATNTSQTEDTAEAHRLAISCGSSGKTLEQNNVLRESARVLVPCGEDGRREPEGSADDYLCKGATAYLSSEPCVMCAMALVHCRVSVAVVLERGVQAAAQSAVCGGGSVVGGASEFGGLGGRFSVHSDPRLNHNFRVIKVKKWEP